MPRPRKPAPWPTVTFTVPPGIHAKLAAVASAKALDLSEYVTTVAVELADGLLRPAGAEEPRRPVGRPPLELPELPADIERSDNATGFTGVYARGRQFAAYYGKDEPLGLFPSAEHAAFARYWYHKGVLSNATRGLPIDQRAAINQTMGGAPLLSFKVGDLVDYDPVIGPLPKQFGKRVTGGPFDGPDGGIFWHVDGLAGFVHQSDLVKANADAAHRE